LAAQTGWADLPGIVRWADLVICNNSGVAHLAAAHGARTLAIYSASHRPEEWGPRGAHVRVVMAMVPCSPCGHDSLRECPNEHACMRRITPEAVCELAVAFLDEAVAGEGVVGETGELMLGGGVPSRPQAPQLNG
jgi:ADP-heptose:LPS heptosyltransferase